MRIVSLCPSLTELVFALGLEEQLVAVTKYCVHPVDGVAKIEKVAGTKDPDVERIIALAPDAVLLNEEENRIEDAEALQEAGIHLVNTFPKTPLETAPMVRHVGKALADLAEGPDEAQGITERAEAIALDIESRCAQAIAAAATSAPVTFAYLIWRKPYMTVNGDTYPSAILEQAGGQNVFASHTERFPAFEIAALIEANPNQIYLCTEPFPFEQKHIDELAAATGFAPERFHIADGEYLSWHGSRTPAGVDYARALVGKAHPA
ncbi:MAG: iron complex transport system substrate-binding protein [Planctomycetota bacterium]|jgi:iron complex transport system substrate-binding protein